MEYQQKTFDIAKEIGNPYDEAIVHKDLGIIYNEQKPSNLHIMIMFDSDYMNYTVSD